MAAANFTSSKLLFGLAMLIAVTLTAMDNSGTTALARPMLHVRARSPVTLGAADHFGATAVARPMFHVPAGSPAPLAARLQSTGDPYSECWDSLMELQACTGEVILFFLNGETHLGRNCCRAILVIQQNCWPSMLGSLGFTEEEGDILRGFCDATADDANTVVRPPPRPRRVPVVKGA